MFFIKFCGIMTIVGLVLALACWVGYQAGKEETRQEYADELAEFDGKRAEYEATIAGLKESVHQMEERVEAFLGGNSPIVEGGPIITLEDLSGCSLGIDHTGLTQWLLERGFTKELRIYVIPAEVPSIKEDGSILAIGTFTPTGYGARIVLDGRPIGKEDFGETEDHEFGHMDQWLDLGQEQFANLSEEEWEEYANPYAEEHDLGFIWTDVPVLKATEEGSQHRSILYRRDQVGPTLFIFDGDNPDKVNVIVDGKVRTAQSWKPEGWHKVSGPFDSGLVTYKGDCVRLE
jgi:hypothetical protein